MNFEDAFKHYREGTATPEEKDYVLDELAKAKAFSNLLDDEGINVTPAPIAQSDIKEIKAAKKQLKYKWLMMAVYTVLAVVVVLGAVLGGVFGMSAKYAKDNMNLSKTDCAAVARAEALAFIEQKQSDDYNGVDKWMWVGVLEGDIRLDDCDEELNMRANLKDCYYTYKVEFDIAGKNTSLQYEVNSVTGSVTFLRVKPS